jgi:hypothetical protein
MSFLIRDYRNRNASLFIKNSCYQECETLMELKEARESSFPHPSLPSGRIKSDQFGTAVSLTMIAVVSSITFRTEIGGTYTMGPQT